MGFISTKLCLFVLLLLICCKYSEEKETVDVFATCPGRKVTTATILEEFVTSSEIGCARACKNNKYCRSTNFIRHEICQLLSDNANCNELPLDDNCEVIVLTSTSDGEAESCHFGQPFNKITAKCDCGDGFRGEYCEQPPRDCSDFCCNGYKYIYLPVKDEKLRAVCAAGWMYILQFFRSSNAFTKYKNSSWDEFKSGINQWGGGEYWIGNEVLHSITTKTNRTYMIEMYVINRNGTGYLTEWIGSNYYDFAMEDEASNYTIHFSGSFVQAKGSIVFFNNTQFQTIDYNSDGCVTKYESVWWYPDDCQLPPPITGNYSIKGVLAPIDELLVGLKRT